MTGREIKKKGREIRGSSGKEGKEEERRSLVNRRKTSGEMSEPASEGLLTRTRTNGGAGEGTGLEQLNLNECRVPGEKTTRN